MEVFENDLDLSMMIGFTDDIDFFIGPRISYTSVVFAASHTQ